MKLYTDFFYREQVGEIFISKNKIARVVRGEAADIFKCTLPSVGDNYKIRYLKYSKQSPFNIEFSFEDERCYDYKVCLNWIQLLFFRLKHKFYWIQKEFFLKLKRSDLLACLAVLIVGFKDQIISFIKFFLNI